MNGNGGNEGNGRSAAAMVREFHEAFGLVIREEPDALAVGDDEIAPRRHLHLEEMDELHRAMDDADTVEVADALADLLYVLHGTALHYGVLAAAASPSLPQSESPSA